MRRIIHRAAIEENQVLVGGTATDIIAAGSLANGGDTWQCENDLHDVRLAEGRRDILQQLGLELLRTHHRVFHRRLPSADHDNLVQFLIVGNTRLGLLHTGNDIDLGVR